MRRTGAVKPHKRSGIWYLVRRVPKEFAELDPRELVRMSTEIAIADDPKAVRAGPRVQALNTELEAYWRGLRDGQSGEARKRFDAARKRALSLGMTYKPLDELAAGRIDELLERVELLIGRQAVDDELDVAAALGGEPKVSLTWNLLLAEYEDMKKAELILKSPNQRRKWKNPRLLAVKNFVEAVGDKALDQTTRSDALKYRNWWLDRIVEEELDIGTANKNIGLLSRMYRDYNKLHQLGLPPIFAEIAIEGETDKQRSAFKPDFVEKSILAPGVLDGLNEEARAILMIVAETGLRISEASALDKTTIVLDDAVPHVLVRPNGRQLKVEHTARDIPLVGVALAAAKQFPAGFPRYRDKADSLSALVNKYLGNHNLLPTENHSFYSLRHTFEDRLTAVDVPEKVIAVLMGHKHQRPKYGEGPTLEHKQRWLQTIAYKPTMHAA